MLPAVAEREPSMSRSRVPAVLLLSAIIAGGALRGVGAFAKPVLYHDESHSYQAATGHVGEAAAITYGRQPPYGQWVAAREWKRLLEPERAFCFVTISRDALAYDVHPPLYYWLLHLFCLAFGTHLWTGPLLNAVLDLFTILALYRFARLATGDRTAAATGAFVFATCAAALQVCVVEARQYSLLTLIAVLYTDTLVRLVRNPDTEPRARRVLLLGVVTALGALTHHHFAILVAVALGWCAVGRVATGRRRRRLVPAAVATAAGYLTLVIVHPFFFGTGFKHLSDARILDAAGVASRTRQVLEAVAHFVLERRGGSELPLAVIAAAACVAPAVFLTACWTLRRPRDGGEGAAAETNSQDARPVGRYALAVGGSVAGVTIGLYLAGVTPAHAMAHRYLALSWPFVALATGMLVANRQGRAIGVCAVALLVGVQASWLQWRNMNWHPGGPEADRVVRAANRVIIDNVGRGHWPRPVFRLRDDAQVLIATPNDLLRRPAPWRGQIEPGTVYISPAKSAVQAREKIHQSLGRDHTVESIGHLAAIGEVYVIR